MPGRLSRWIVRVRDTYRIPSNPVEIACLEHTPIKKSNRETSRRGIAAPSRRRDRGDNVAAKAWCARNLISTGPAGTIQAASVADANAQFSKTYYQSVPEGTIPNHNYLEVPQCEAFAAQKKPERFITPFRGREATSKRYIAMFGLFWAANQLGFASNPPG